MSCNLIGVPDDEGLWASQTLKSPGIVTSVVEIIKDKVKYCYPAYRVEKVEVDQFAMVLYSTRDMLKTNLTVIYELKQAAWVRPLFHATPDSCEQYEGYKYVEFLAIALGIRNTQKNRKRWLREVETLPIDRVRNQVLMESLNIKTPPPVFDSVGLTEYKEWEERLTAAMKSEYPVYKWMQSIVYKNYVEMIKSTCLLAQTYSWPLVYSVLLTWLSKLYLVYVGGNEVKQLSKFYQGLFKDFKSRVSENDLYLAVLGLKDNRIPIKTRLFKFLRQISREGQFGG